MHPSTLQNSPHTLQLPETRAVDRSLATALTLALAAPLPAQLSSPTGPLAPATRQGSGTALLHGGGDECITATPILGQGRFAYDNRAATTGSTAQDESLCRLFNDTAIDNDVWFLWTADADGVVHVSTCGGTTDDVKLAAHPATLCPPPPGSALACSDDSCGLEPSLQASLQFPVTRDTSYLLQVGNSPGSQATLPGVLDISISGDSGNDDCATPEELVGQGSFPFDSSSATSGTAGQIEVECFLAGSIGIENDLWFTWTADADGEAVVETCGSSFDTKLAVYPGATACPTTGTALDCDDDTCGLASRVRFPVRAGSSYVLQVGSSPGTPGGAGVLGISIDVLGERPECYAADDGSTETNLGLISGGELCWLMGFEARGGGDVITAIATTYGSPTFPSLSPALPSRVALWDDPTDDLDPSDAVLLWSTTIVAAAEDTDLFNVVPVPDVPVSGIFFVGASIENLVNQYPAPLDSSVPSLGRAWITASTAGFGTLDLDDLTLNDQPPTAMETVSPGVFLLRAEGRSCAPLGRNYCTAGANSVSPAGSLLTATGSASLADQDLFLTASNAPDAPALFFFGSQQVDLPFGCGRRCVAGATTRLPVVFGSGGTFEYRVPPSTFSVLGVLWTASFQCWYRDPAGQPACGSSFNLSDAREIVFVP